MGGAGVVVGLGEVFRIDRVTFMKVKSMESSADRTRGRKKIFGIFGFINTIKITNGKFSEVASLVLTIEIERLFVHAHESVLEAASV